ncbi:MAG: T9SS type A sorting domain-containing protein [Bacteroidia bacterium]
MKKNILLTIATLLLLSLSSFTLAQSFTPFQKYIGNGQRDIAFGIETMTDTSFLVYGVIQPDNSNPADGLLLEINRRGDVLGSQFLEQGGREGIRGAFILPRGNIMTAGNTNHNGNRTGNDDFAINKVGKNGSVVTANYVGTSSGDEQMHGSILSNDYHMISVGIDAQGASVSGLLNKVDTAGNSLWAKTWSTGPDRDGFWAVTEANQGYYVTGGTNFQSPTDINSSLCYIDQNGNLIFSKIYNDGSPSDNPASQNIRPICKLNDTSILFAESVSRGVNDYDILLINADSAGDVRWAKTYGGTGEEVAQFIKVAKDGNIIVGGQTTSFGNAGNADGMLFKIDHDGNIMWAHAYGGMGKDVLLNVKGFGGKASGGYLIVGETTSFNTNSSSDIYLLGVRDDGTGFSTCFTEDIPLETETRTITVQTQGSLGNYTIFPTRTATVQSGSLTSITTGCEGTSSIAQTISPQTISISPNPSTGIIRAASSEYRILGLRIYDMAGRMLHGRYLAQPASETSIHIAEAGVYVLSIETTAGIVRKKVIIQ